LKLENTFTAEAAMNASGENLVFDTTGSVAHIHEDTQKMLRENCLVVHLDVGENSLSELIENFFLKPKPVCWSGYFEQETNEDTKAAIRRCYPKLLHARLQKYRELAHINILAKDLFDADGKKTLEVIQSYL
jgi:shikimate kinase